MIRNKMEKLKDLYLNDLIQKDMYEAEYTLLREELEKALIPQQKQPKPVDLQAIKDSLSMYPALSREGKKEFWSRIVKKN